MNDPEVLYCIAQSNYVHLFCQLPIGNHAGTETRIVDQWWKPKFYELFAKDYLFVQNIYDK